MTTDPKDPTTSALDVDGPEQLPPLRYPRLMLVATCGGVGAILGLTSGATAAIPDIGLELGASQKNLQWIGDAFPLLLSALLLSALLLPAGALLDRYGRKRGMILGYFILALSMVLTGFATNVEQVIAGRCAAESAPRWCFPARSRPSRARYRPRAG